MVRSALVVFLGLLFCAAAPERVAGQATFRSLTDGAWELSYVPSSGQTRPTPVIILPSGYVDTTTPNQVPANAPSPLPARNTAFLLRTYLQHQPNWATVCQFLRRNGFLDRNTGEDEYACLVQGGRLSLSWSRVEDASTHLSFAIPFASAEEVLLPWLYYNFSLNPAGSGGQAVRGDSPRFTLARLFEYWRSEARIPERGHPNASIVAEEGAGFVLRFAVDQRASSQSVVELQSLHFRPIPPPR